MNSECENIDDLSDEKKKENDNNTDQNIDSLNSKIKALEQQIEMMGEDNVILSRRVWYLFEDMSDASFILSKIEKFLGKEKFKKIYYDFMETERDGTIEHQRELARLGLGKHYFKPTERKVLFKWSEILKWLGDKEQTKRKNINGAENKKPFDNNRDKKKNILKKGKIKI
jgi:hypothetical protein